MKPTIDQLTVSESFFEPALRLLRDYCRHRRDTPELGDEQFLRWGLQRVLGHCDSGRDFLQACQDRRPHRAALSVTLEDRKGF